MTKYLISFPARAMEVPAEDFAAVGEAARGVVREAKAAGVYVAAARRSFASSGMTPRAERPVPAS
jgi:hypothetical protein